MKVDPELEVLLALDGRIVEPCTCAGAPESCSELTGRVFIPPKDMDYRGDDAQIPCKKHLNLYLECGWREYGVE